MSILNGVYSRRSDDCRQACTRRHYCNLTSGFLTVNIKYTQWSLLVSIGRLSPSVHASTLLQLQFWLALRGVPRVFWLTLRGVTAEAPGADDSNHQVSEITGTAQPVISIKYCRTFILRLVHVLSTSHFPG